MKRGLERGLLFSIYGTLFSVPVIAAAQVPLYLLNAGSGWSLAAAILLWFSGALIGFVVGDEY